MPAKKSCSRSRLKASSAEKGSSMKSTSGSAMRARPSARRCRWPPESSEGQRFSRPVRPNSSIIAEARKAPSVAETGEFLSSKGRRRFPSTVFHGKSPRFCQTKLERTWETGAPAASVQVSVPAAGFKSPATVVSSVVFPQPDSPTIAKDAPAGSVKATLSNTVRLP